MRRSLVTELTEDVVGQRVLVQGWLHGRRDHGGLIFIDLRDHTGLLQLVIQPDDKVAFSLAEGLRDEFVLAAQGELKKRSAEAVNTDLASGQFELAVSQLKLLNRSETPPIPIDDGHQQVNEDKRLQYRYLDLRRPKMQKMLRRRAEYYQLIRGFMDKLGFVEVSTPILANSSPEGARDFLVPSRVHPNKFYALPQAPQQFKQLLMVGGLDKYYQIAACFRDEDPRADRLYGDFYQLDLEMAFIDDGQTIRDLTEPLVQQLVTDFAGKQLNSADKFPTLSYQQAMDRYGSDKPDIRFAMELVDVSQIVKASDFNIFRQALDKGEIIKAIVVPSNLSRRQLDELTTLAQQTGAGGLPHMLYRAGKFESTIAKFFDDACQQQLASSLAIKDDQTVLFALGNPPVVNQTLASLRQHLGKVLKLADDNLVAPLWVVDFPFYELDEQSGQLDFGHNPFSMPKGGLEALETADKLTILADQFDLVVNGYEVCSGAIRNHDPAIMYKVFSNLGYQQDYVEAKFGALLNAFRFGAPPHGGCAFGLDRLLMILLTENNIRDVIAFPKNGSGVDPMMQSPSPVDRTQLKELNL